MGVGNAFFGVVNLLINRGAYSSIEPNRTILTVTENLYKRVNGIVCFVSENPVRAVSSHTQTWLSKWYRDVSQRHPITSNNH
jgi:histone deacetylase 6